MNSEERTIVLISTSHGMMHAYLVLLPAMIPILGGELGDIATVGMLASLVSLFYGWLSLPVGFMADRLSRKTLVAASMFLCGGASVIIGLSPNIPVAALGLVLLGAGASLYHPAGYAHMSAVSDENRGRYMGIQGLGGDMGMAVSYLTSSVLGSAFGWRATFLIWGVVGLAMGALDMMAAQDIQDNTHNTQHPGPVETFKRMFGVSERRTLLLTLGLVVLSGMLWTGVASFIMVFIEEVKHTNFLIAGGLSTLKYTVGAFAQILGGEMSDRFGRRRLLLLGYLGFAIFLVAFVLAPGNLAVLTLLVVALGFTFFITQSPMNALLGDVSRKDTVGVTYGVNFTLKYGVGFFTPAIAGYLALNHGLPSVFYFFAALSLLATVITLAIRERPRPAS